MWLEEFGYSLTEIRDFRCIRVLSSKGVNVATKSTHRATMHAHGSSLWG